ncbi:c-type cytochrome [Shewanella cyperi]|uniref:C-type cytochrome n=2 Tax=Shewanella cyperi TaxID=2814292 RepID=A0A974XJJ3_9GAMM|nr:c-type cytochrome [Shewanella cyperi]QSX29560.1 c-type cytochrome [Shewanella cyperi]
MKHTLLILGATVIPLAVPMAWAEPPTEEAQLPDRQTQLPSSPKLEDQHYLSPRPLNTIPQGAFGDKVRLGYQLFVNSQQLRDKYVGNELNCVNCHMDAGRKPNASPFWGAFFAYPAYRKKNDKVNSFEERIQGCFTYSMNGKAPPSGSPELVALSAYAYWLGMGGLMDQYGVTGEVPELADAELLQGGKRDDFPVPAAISAALTTEQRANLPGRGYPAIPKPELPYDPARGALVYEAHCQNCHGSDGQGQAMGGVYNLPPLWGPQSFNWGAGMHRVNTAAFFIHENMPLGKSIQLSNQQAWDVAAFITSKERPQDPRFEGNLEQTKASYHKHDGYYGTTQDGTQLGKDAFPNLPPKP